MYRLGLVLWLVLVTCGVARAQTPPPAAAPADTTSEPRSLFEPTWHQFEFGGRFTDVNGDPARFQRYQDLRDGATLTDFRFARTGSSDNWLFRATADNVGYRDQRYSALYERTGRFVVSGLWDEIPQFYSVDTKTPYTMSAGQRSEER